MSPFHPKLRKALLDDPVHKKNNLTEKELLRYEGLIQQYFEHWAYGNNENSEFAGNNVPDEPNSDAPPEQRNNISTTANKLYQDIIDIRNRLMPNYEQHYNKWIADQKKKVLTKHLGLNPWPLFIGGLAWIWASLRGDKKYYVKKG